MLAQTDNEPDDQVRVVVRFLPLAAKRLMKTTWHPTQTIQIKPDGSCLFTAYVSKEGIDDFTHWIYEWGAAVEVLQPEELRKQMIERIRAMEAMYHQHEQELLGTLNDISLLYAPAPLSTIMQ